MLKVNLEPLGGRSWTPAFARITLHLFSAVKRKLSARAPGRTLRPQMRLALLLGLSFNMYRLKHRCHLRGMSTEPTYLIHPKQIIWVVLRKNDDTTLIRCENPCGCENASLA
jgi:hypothetical protein